MKYAFLFFFFIYTSLQSLGQANICADSSIRIQYSTANDGMSAFPYPDTSGVNYFAGGYALAPSTAGALLFGTDWGENILFAKKFYQPGGLPGLNIYFGNVIKSPDGGLISTGVFPNGVLGVDYLMVKTNTAGQLIWAKKYRLNQINSNHGNSNFRSSITFQGNSMYVTISLDNIINYHIISKLDLDGNILWSRSFDIASSVNYISFTEHPVIVKNDTVISYCQKNYLNSSSGVLTQATLILSKLNANTGAFIEATEYQLPPQIYLDIYAAKLYNNNTIGFTGNIGLPGIPPFSNYLIYPVSVYIDSNYNVQSAAYFKSPITDIGFEPVAYGINNRQQQIFLISNRNTYIENYFLVTGSNNDVQKTRKFFIPALITNGSDKTIDFDDKENVHFTYTYSEPNRAVLEYARISDLAPSNTLNCFGRDTSIFTAQPFSISKAPFTWDRTDINPLTSATVNLIEENLIITKTLVCKQVSRCDSININGIDTICKNEIARYTLYRNPACLKSLEWNIDTSIADIITTEADTAITLRFKHSGYLRANVYNCVVKDSIWVTVKEAKTAFKINKDYLLCPGKTILLQASLGFQNYTWQDGSTQSSFLVISPGFYKVIAKDSCGNIFKDSINISSADTSFNIPASTEICLFDTTFIQLPANTTNLVWQPLTSSFRRNNMLLFYPDRTTLYSISTEPSLNCPVTKTLTVNVKICPDQFFMPNSFTPNNDGLNDVFKPKITGYIQFYYFVIYNRYGQKVFETNDRSQGWDGKFKQAAQEGGTYVWKCSYKFNDKLIESKEGYCLLIH